MSYTIFDLDCVVLHLLLNTTLRGAGEKHLCLVRALNISQLILIWLRLLYLFLNTRCHRYNNLIINRWPSRCHVYQIICFLNMLHNNLFFLHKVLSLIITITGVESTWLRILILVKLIKKGACEILPSQCKIRGDLVFIWFGGQRRHFFVVMVGKYFNIYYNWYNQ